MKVFIYLNKSDYSFTDSEDCEILLCDSLADCFTAASSETDSAMLFELSGPISKVQDLFTTIQNYETLPTMLAFYIYDPKTVIYALSNEGAFRNDLATLFLKCVGRYFETVLNSWDDKNTIAELSGGKLCIRSDSLKRNDYLVELFRGINKYEFQELLRYMKFDLREDGYYLFAWHLREYPGPIHTHHTFLKNIYYFVESLFQMECGHILSLYFGGEAFYDGARNLYVLANLPYPQNSPTHKRLLKDLSRDLARVMGAGNAHRYRSRYFRSATNADKAYLDILSLKEHTFFLRDEELISPAVIDSEKLLPDLKTVTSELGQIQQLIIYDTLNPRIASHIQDLFLNTLKRSMDIPLVMYCYNAILSSIYEKGTNGYHLAPNLTDSLTTDLHRSYIEIESNNLCQMLQWLQSDSAVNIPATKNNLINKAIDYIQTNYMSEITLNDISEHLNITSVYLSQLFKKELGLSPIKYINNYRIDQAKRLLQDMDEPIYHIAVKVGFWEAKHFSKTFKRITGMTPSEFRRQNVFSASIFSR